VVLGLIEHRQLAPAAPLGQVHGLVGVIDELVMAGGIDREDARPQRHADLERAAVDRERLLEHRQHPPSDLLAGHLRLDGIVG
jgi:hypothetical protein